MKFALHTPPKSLYQLVKCFWTIESTPDFCPNQYYLMADGSALKNKKGGDIIVYGGSSFVSSLRKAGLIEFNFGIVALKYMVGRA